jgi:RNA polymerase sigma-70 factor (ECF subfamily)
VSDAKERVYLPLLILRCQTGDEAALRELIERYSPGLRLFLCKITGQESLADDLLQESWFDVYRKINSLQSPDSFAAWLYRIARDKAYRHLRRRSLPSESNEGNLVETLAADEERFSPDEAEDVRTALDELPLEQREVLLLRFVEDMSYEQITQVIGRPVGTVRSRIHYAKLALRAKLELKTVRKDMPS